MKIVFIFFCICIFYGSSHGQDAKIEITGSVYDVNTDAPLVNATIKLKDKNLGAITNELGRFSLLYNKLPFILVISHIGYETQEYLIELEPLRPITIKMHPKTKLLKGVVVTSEKIDTVYHDRHYSVMDYELTDKGILLLIYKYNLNRSELLLTDFTGQKVNYLNIIPGKPLRLFKDCFKNIHIFTKTRSYQVYFEKGKIRLYPAVDLEWFINTMQYCKFFVGDKMYFKETAFLNLINDYYYIDTITKGKHLIHTVKDQEKIDFLNYNPENFSLLSGNSGPDLSDLKGLPSDKAILDLIRFMDIEKRFNRMAYFPPMFAPMLKLGDTICIFNYPGSKIEFFNYNDSLIKKTEIDYHLSEKPDQIQTVVHSVSRKDKWQPEIYIDQKTRKVYSLFLNSNGTITLKEIDINTGKIKVSMKIPFPYVSKINIDNGYVYFIYKGWGETRKKKLFRQQID